MNTMKDQQAEIKDLTKKYKFLQTKYLADIPKLNEKTQKLFKDYPDGTFNEVFEYIKKQQRIANCHTRFHSRKKR